MFFFPRSLPHQPEANAMANLSSNPVSIHESARDADAYWSAAFTIKPSARFLSPLEITARPSNDDNPQGPGPSSPGAAIAVPTPINDNCGVATFWRRAAAVALAGSVLLA